MAWGFVAHRGSNTTKTTGATISVQPTANLIVGSVAVIRCVSDNITTSSSQSNDHSVADDKVNTWIKVREHTRSVGAASDGVTVSLFISIITTQIDTTDNITLTCGNIDAKAIAIEELSITAGSTLSIAGSNAAVGSTTTPSVTLGSLSNKEYLWLGAVGIEGPNTDSYTQDTDYANNTSIGTTGGANPSNVEERFGTRVFTGTTDTFNPTVVSRDWAVILGAVEEIPGAVSNERYETRRLHQSFGRF